MLIASGDEPHIVASKPLKSGDRVCGDRRIRAANVRNVVDIKQWRCNCKRNFCRFRSHTAQLAFPQQKYNELEIILPLSKENLETFSKDYLKII